MGGNRRASAALVLLVMIACGGDPDEPAAAPITTTSTSTTTTLPIATLSVASTSITATADFVEIPGTTEPGAAVEALWSGGSTNATADASGRFVLRVGPLSEGGTTVNIAVRVPGRAAASTSVAVTRPVTGTRENPVRLGQARAVGQWEVAVVRSIPNASRQVMAANQFNDPPAPGRQFYIATVRVKYTGSGSSSPLRLAFSAVGLSNVTYQLGSQDSCGVIPDPLTPNELFTGGTVTGNVCWSVSAADAGSLVLIAEDRTDFTQATRNFFALR